jgi:predicted neutral ceramidase superfamily lipid hydrolase
MLYLHYLLLVACWAVVAVFALLTLVMLCIPDEVSDGVGFAWLISAVAFVFALPWLLYAYHSGLCMVSL